MSTGLGNGLGRPNVKMDVVSEHSPRSSDTGSARAPSSTVHTHPHTRSRSGAGGFVRSGGLVLGIAPTAALGGAMLLHGGCPSCGPNASPFADTNARRAQPGS